MYYGFVMIKEKIENRCICGLICRIKMYNEWFMNYEGYDIMIFLIGDGVVVSKKRGWLRYEEIWIVSNVKSGGGYWIICESRSRCGNDWWVKVWFMFSRRVFMWRCKISCEDCIWKWCEGICSYECYVL